MKNRFLVFAFFALANLSCDLMGMEITTQATKSESPIGTTFPTNQPAQTNQFTPASQPPQPAFYPTQPQTIFVKSNKAEDEPEIRTVRIFDANATQGFDLEFADGKYVMNEDENKDFLLLFNGQTAIYKKKEIADGSTLSSKKIFIADLSKLADHLIAIRKPQIIEDLKKNGWFYERRPLTFGLSLAFLGIIASPFIFAASRKGYSMFTAFLLQKLATAQPQS